MTPMDHVSLPMCDKDVQWCSLLEQTKLSLGHLDLLVKEEIISQKERAWWIHNTCLLQMVIQSILCHKGDLHDCHPICTKSAGFVELKLSSWFDRWGNWSQRDEAGPEVTQLISVWGSIHMLISKTQISYSEEDWKAFWMSKDKFNWALCNDNGVCQGVVWCARACVPLMLGNSSTALATSPCQYIC